VDGDGAPAAVVACTTTSAAVAAAVASSLVLLSLLLLSLSEHPYAAKASMVVLCFLSTQIHTTFFGYSPRKREVYDR
jgi:hypothetical protein